MIFDSENPRSNQSPIATASTKDQHNITPDSTPRVPFLALEQCSRESGIFLWNSVLVPD